VSTRPIFAPTPVITNGDMTTTLTSKVSIISNISMMSYSYSWSGISPSGSITVQVSNDYSLDSTGKVLNAGTWDTLPLSAATTVSGNTGVGFVDIDQLGGQAIRTVYTPVSGSGTLNCIYKGKVS
jgi:hypothetical protein